MSFRESDFKEIFEWRAHTVSISQKAHPLLRLTPDRIGELIAKPRIQHAYSEKLISKLELIVAMIEAWESPEKIIRAFLDIRSSAHLPFSRIIDSLRSKMYRILSRRENSSFDLDLLVKRGDHEVKMLRSIDVWYWRFNWSGWADIIGMNGNLGRTLSWEPEQSMDDFVRYIEVISRCALSEYMKNPQPSTIDWRYIQNHGKFMDSIFNYQWRVYRFKLIEEPLDRVPKEIFDAVMTLFPLHTFGTTQWKDILVDIEIWKSNDWIEVRWRLCSEIERKIEKPKDLKDHSFVWSVDGSFFLQSIVDTFPEIVQFERRREKIVFRIKMVD